ncbi:MAG: hypothetical protein K1X38_17015 [Microthrixaceae bacterium]|nr:hypothetical protein [Microthrixaceae bacterium]
MRTTLTIRDDLYEAVRRQAFNERRGLGDVVNELIEAGLMGGPGRQRTLGTYAGQITVSDDFDDELEEFTDALVEPVEP